MAIITNVADWAADHEDEDVRPGKPRIRTMRPERVTTRKSYRAAAQTAREYARKSRAGR